MTSSSTAVESDAQTATLDASRLRHVNLVSGQVIQVQGDKERDWFEATRDRYLNQTEFTQETDKQDLDRLLVMELMIYRWTAHIASGADYEGILVDEKDLQRNIKLYSDQITKLKDSMGLSKKARAAEADKGNVSDYIDGLKAKAKRFGIMREKQLDKALELLKELFALVEVFERCDQEERDKIGFPDEASILEWIRETAKPEFDAIDAHFRENEQRYWIREM